MEFVKKTGINKILLILNPEELRPGCGVSPSIQHVRDLVAQLPCQIFAICAAPGREAGLTDLLDNMSHTLLPISKQQWQQAQPLPSLHWVPVRSTRSVLKHIEKHGVDLVVKSADKNLTSASSNHFDYRLMRDCPVPVWFVKDQKRVIERIAAAVGRIPISREDDYIEHRDYDTYTTACELGKVYDAKVTAIHIVHGAESTGLSTFNNAREQVVSDAPASYHSTTEKIVYTKPRLAPVSRADHHGQQLANFRECFDLVGDALIVKHGKPAEEIPGYVAEADVDLLVLSAESMSRWERMINETTAESVLARSPSDVLVARRLDRRFTDLLKQLSRYANAENPVDWVKERSVDGRLGAMQVTEIV